MRAILSVIAISALSVACGGNSDQPPPATPTSAPAPETKGAEAHHEGHEGGGHEDHGAMSPAIKDFHATIKPIWHSGPGAERTGKACAGEKDMAAKASAVGDAELTAAVGEVTKACASADKKDVESKLSAVHDRFHKLVEKK